MNRSDGCKNLLNQKVDELRPLSMTLVDRLDEDIHYAQQLLLCTIIRHWKATVWQWTPKQIFLAARAPSGLPFHWRLALWAFW